MQVLWPHRGSCKSLYKSQYGFGTGSQLFFFQQTMLVVLFFVLFVLFLFCFLCLFKAYLYINYSRYIMILYGSEGGVVSLAVHAHPSAVAQVRKHTIIHTHSYTQS